MDEILRNSVYLDLMKKNNIVVKVTPPSKNIVLLFGQPEKEVISMRANPPGFSGRLLTTNFKQKTFTLRISDQII